MVVYISRSYGSPDHTGNVTAQHSAHTPRRVQERMQERIPRQSFPGCSKGFRVQGAGKDSEAWIAERQRGRDHFAEM